MLLAFNTRRMVISAYLALYPKRFTVQMDFAVSDKYSYKKIYTASLGTTRWVDLSTRHHISLVLDVVVTYARMSPSQRCRTHIISVRADDPSKYHISPIHSIDSLSGWTSSIGKQ